MLREASLSQMRSLKLPREARVLVNRGRGNDELAPSAELFSDFQAAKKTAEILHGKGSAETHNRAFLSCDFEPRFRAQIEGDPAALNRLEELTARSTAEDVFVVCYEGNAKACHRRILMRIAEERFGAEVHIEGVEPT